MVEGGMIQHFYKYHMRTVDCVDMAPTTQEQIINLEIINIILGDTFNYYITIKNIQCQNHDLRFYS